MYNLFFKRVVDLFVAVCLLLLTLPLLIIVSLLLLVVNRGKVFFTQLRPGKDERIFRIVKFKTMTDATDEKGVLLADADRLTGIGKFVRKTSLDELPQLVNIIKGDMSLIGPRPLLTEYLPLYNEIQRKRHLVRPGLTGWAQVNGRNTISWEQKFAYDVWYVNHISLWLDLRIFFKSIGKLLQSKDVNSETAATMEKFTGTK